MQQRQLTTALLIGGMVCGVLGIIVVIGVTAATYFATPIRDVTAVPIPTVAPTGEATAVPTVPSEPTGQIVYTCFIAGYDELCRMNADGSGKVQLTDVNATDWYASYGPLGDLIVFSTRRDNAFEVYTMAADGTNIQRITRGVSGNYAPDISPDGTRIVFASEAFNNRQDVVMTDIDGGSPIQLTDRPGEAFDPVWSPDGTMISFTADWTGTNELYQMNADGSNVRQVTSGSGQDQGGRNDWSPDGQWIGFYAGPSDNKDIYLVRADCTLCGPSEYIRLTDGGDNRAPSFSPDGGWITFTSFLRGNNDVFIMRIDGTDWRQLTDEPRPDWQPRWGP